MLSLTYEKLLSEGVNVIIERKVLPYLGVSPPYSVVREPKNKFTKSTSQKLCAAVKNYLQFCQAVTSAFPDAIAHFEEQRGGCPATAQCLEGTHTGKGPRNTQAPEVGGGKPYSHSHAVAQGHSHVRWHARWRPASPATVNHIGKAELRNVRRDRRIGLPGV